MKIKCSQFSFWSAVCLCHGEVRCFLLLLDIGAERSVRRENRNGQSCQGALVLVWTVARGHQAGVGGVAGTLICHQRQSMTHPSTTLGLSVCSTGMCAAEAHVQDSWPVAQCCDSRVSFRVPLSLCHTWRSHRRSVLLTAVREAQQSVRCKSVVSPCALH